MQKNMVLSKKQFIIHEDKISFEDFYNRDELELIIGHQRKNFVYKDKYLYFFISELGRIKIGQAINVEERRKGIENQSGMKIDVLKKIKNAAQYEKILHKRFKKYKMIGEWFERNNELTNFIESLNLEVLNNL
jgi:hypothetical protein